MVFLLFSVFLCGSLMCFILLRGILLVVLYVGLAIFGYFVYNSPSMFFPLAFSFVVLSSFIITSLIDLLSCSVRFLISFYSF